MNKKLRLIICVVHGMPSGEVAGREYKTVEVETNEWPEAECYSTASVVGAEVLPTQEATSETLSAGEGE